MRLAALAVLLLFAALLVAPVVGVQKKAHSKHSRLDKIEEDISFLSKLLRHAPTHEDAATVERPAAVAPVPTLRQDVLKVQAAASLGGGEVPVVQGANNKPAAGDEPSALDQTFQMFPAGSFPHTSPPPPRNMTIRRSPAPQQQPWAYMPELDELKAAAAHRGLIRGSRDAVTCPGAPLHECGGHGMCDNGVCRCDVQWYGPDCSLERCSPPCSAHGVCRNGTCECENGWGGATCDVEVCYPPCTSHGRCEGTTCVCDPGYGTETCAGKMCLNDCSGPAHGACEPETGVCECAEGWGSPDCSLPVYACVYDCLNGGFCNNGTCSCPVGWEGPDCTRLSAPRVECQGGSEWSTAASRVVLTCATLSGEDGGPFAPNSVPERTVARCACPDAAPVWDQNVHQCVAPEACRPSACGDLLAVPAAGDVSLAVLTKPECSWLADPESACGGCVDAARPVTVCFRAGYELAERIQDAREVAVALFREGGACPGVDQGGEPSLEAVVNATEPVVETDGSTKISPDNSASSVSRSTVTYAAPDLSAIPGARLSGLDLTTAGSVQISVPCVGRYKAQLFIIANTLQTSAFGGSDCVVTAENASCPGVPACSGNGVCHSGLEQSQCECKEGFFGPDCSAHVVQARNGNVTVLPNNITTTLPVPPTANITVEPDRVVVVVPANTTSAEEEEEEAAGAAATEETTYVLWTNGTTEIHRANGSVVVFEREPTDPHGCDGGTLWQACSLGCFPTCRNPKPLCNPTCLSGACQCPESAPLWDDMLQQCVAPEGCTPQVPCPGIGAVCAGKGRCVNSTCECVAGYSGPDCSVFADPVPRVTTRSGTVQEVVQCAFPFTFRGRVYDDCTTDFESGGKEWCSTTPEWEHRWGFCAERGACPVYNGLECNGRGACRDGACECEDLFSGADCSQPFMRFTNETMEPCRLPFLGPDQLEHLDCVPGVPEYDADGQLVDSVPNGDGSSSLSSSSSSSWCLTTFRFEGPGSVGFCQPEGACGNCSLEGGVCDGNSGGACRCKPGYEGLYCDEKLTEREILLDLYTRTSGEDWSRRSNWGRQGSPCVEPVWSGVTCNAAGNVVRLNLDSVGLAGTIPESLAALPALEVLDLSNNALGGTFPAALVRSPRTLKFLSVSGNMLVGQAPVLPARIVYSDFSQNYLVESVQPSFAVRVTDGSGTVPAFVRCAFPFEFHGKNYTGCTKEWTTTGKAWCSTTPEYEGKWGSCADVNVCPGAGGKECSGHGQCEKATSADGITLTCKCDFGFTGAMCEHSIARVTERTMNGQSEDVRGQPCKFPFYFNGKEYNGCTTDGSEEGKEWCLTTTYWERSWGYCAELGACPGARHACSGHGTCTNGVCECEEGWIWNDCSHRIPRVTRSGQSCQAPFSLDGIEYNDCTTAPNNSRDPWCALAPGVVEESNSWDFCAPAGTCPGQTPCSDNGYCVDGECVCHTGFGGNACDVVLTPRDALVKLFRRTQGLSWVDGSSWESGSECSWFGITCDERGQVIGIKLANNNLDGALPDDLSIIDTLQSLDVSGNLLAGPVPHFLASFPNLVSLNLSNNQFVGELPAFSGSVEVECDGNCIESSRCAKGSCGFPF